MTGLSALVIGLSAQRRLIIYKKILESEITDQMRPVNADLTHPSVRSFHCLAACSRGADASVRPTRPDAASTRPVMNTV